MAHAWFKTCSVAERNPLLFLLAFYSVATPSGADEFRLFTTPAQREALDYIRRAGPSQTHSTLPAAPEPLTTRADSSFLVRGLVQRHGHGGVNTVWINDSSTLRPQDLAPNLHVETHKIRDANVPISIDEHVVILKPGQVYLGDGQPVIESMLSKPVQSHGSASGTRATDPNNETGSTVASPMPALLERAARAADKPGSEP